MNAPSPIPRTVVDVFFHRAIQSADHIAIESDAETLTYSQLANLATVIAAALHERGIGRGDIVALPVERSAMAVAAMLGVWKVSAAFAPIDRSQPSTIRNAICDDCRPKLAIIDANDSSSWSCDVIALETLCSNASSSSRNMADATIQSNDPACIMYTSGSTGSPKGVVIPHRAIVRLVIDNNYACLDAQQTLLQLAPLSFDASLFEIWGALLNGGKLAIPPSGHLTLDAIAATIKRHQVTTLWLTAGLFHLMVDHCIDGLKPLKQLLSGGDVLSPAHVYKALQQLPDCTLTNAYGPTENTTFSCCYTMPRNISPTAPISIGKTIANTTAYILDDELSPVEVGDMGELFVGGEGLALGYLNRPEQTAERFIEHPTFGRLYRTGDQVRMRADGNLEFFGRRDRQVKINGKRVELDDVEATLRQSDLIEDVAIVCTQTTSSRRILAFVVARATFSATAFQTFIRDHLADHMRPSTVTVIKALPLTATGKIDRARLATAATTREPNGRTAPKNEIEATLLRLWRETLHVDSIGMEENFFDVGGTSLQLLELHASITSATQRELKLTDLFQHPTIASLASLLSTNEVGDVSARTQLQSRIDKQRSALLRARARAHPPVNG